MFININLINSCVFHKFKISC